MQKRTTSKMVTQNAFSGRAILTKVSKDREERAAEARAAQKLARAVKKERPEEPDA